VQPVTDTPPDIAALLAGTHADEDYLLAAAYAALAEAAAASDDARATAQRVQLFTDTAHAPSLWAACVRRALLVLGQDYQRLLRRGADPPAGCAPLLPIHRPPCADAHAAAPPAPAAAAPAKPPPLATPALKGPIFRAAPASPLQVLADGLASGGALEAAEQRVPVFLKALGAGPVLARTEGAVKALEDKIHAAPGAVVQKIQSAPPARVGGALSAYADVRARVQGWWVRPRPARVAEACLPRRDIDASIARGASLSICVPGEGADGAASAVAPAGRVARGGPVRRRAARHPARARGAACVPRGC
jgi:nucleoporin NDC1